MSVLHTKQPTEIKIAHRICMFANGQCLCAGRPGVVCDRALSEATMIISQVLSALRAQEQSHDR